MAIQFTETYLPALVELQTDAVQDARTRLESFSRANWPDMETSPNTVLGDLLLTPQAYMIAAVEEGMGRFMSDLDLGNVANGIIYNCDFVEQYLKNFGVDRSNELRSSGVLRLVFSESKRYELDRSTQFNISDVVFSIWLPATGPYVINPVGVPVAAGENGTTLFDNGSGAYFADIPVVGNEFVDGVEIAQGTSALSNIYAVPELAAITALVDFDSGVDDATLPKLAERTRKTIYAASMNTRNGAIRYIDSICPFVESAYALCPGDTEMLWDTSNTFGMSESCLQLLARSKSFRFTETGVVKLRKFDDIWKGTFTPTGQPYHIEDVNITGYSVDTGEAIPYSFTDRGFFRAGFSTAYSPYAQFELTVQDVKNDSNDTAYPVFTDDDGNYILVNVVYKTDPMLPAIAAATQSPDNVPAGTIVATTGFTPVIINTFTVQYVRKPGVVPLLDEAREVIEDYLGNLGAPDVYSDAPIITAMQEAGVKYVKDISTDAFVQWSIADKYNAKASSSAADTLVDVPTGTPIQGSATGLRITAAPEATTGVNTFACSPRTVRYYLMENAVRFVEVKEM